MYHVRPAGSRGLVLATCAATKRTAPVATAVTCDGDKSGTPFPSAGTSGPTASAVAIAIAIATRYDKRAYVFHGTVILAAIRLWLRP